MAGYEQQLFKIALRKLPEERTKEDLDVIFSFMRGMETFNGLREPALRCICKGVRYEFHAADDILYCRGELATCWYILLTGSVFIDGYMFLPNACFGKRTSGRDRRQNECLILERSEMIAIDYPDVHLLKSNQRASQSHPQQMNNLDTLLALDPEETRMGRGRFISDSNSHTDSQTSTELAQIQNAVQRCERQYLRTNEHFHGKRNSRASDTSSAYSGSDRMQGSIEGDPDLDFSGLPESNVDNIDSDDEEGYSETSDSLIVRDTVRECLEKDPAERTEDDIEVLLEFMQHFPAFANMTLPIRRALCAVMVFAVVEKAGTIVMNDGEELDSWSVILNGHVEVKRPDGTIEHHHMGDSFGITPTTEKQCHKGVMKTKIDDCQFVCIAQDDYYRILHQGEENTRRHKENDEVVMVTEHRILDGGNRKGHIVIRGTPDKLMKHLVEEHSSVDPTYVEDFLLTYRTFIKNPVEVADKLLTWFEDPNLRNRVTRVVLLWVNNHFNDFETNNRLSEFLEKFEQLLEGQRMGGQLRLLNIACAAKARPRTVVLTRATREEILHFSILGGIERGCGIFIQKVERGSKAQDSGLKRGDQVLEVNNQNFEHISHNRALEILRGTTHLSITVKSNLLAFNEMLITPDNSPGMGRSKKDHISSLQHDPKQRLSVDEGIQQPVISAPGKKPGDKKGFMTHGSKAKLRKALMKFSFLPRNVNSDSSLNSYEDSSSNTSRGRKSTTSSAHSSPLHTPHTLTHSASNPDLTSASQYDEMKSDYPEHVIKVYKADQTCKYFLIHRETTAREVVMLSLKEFGISDQSRNYSLCEVTVEQEGLIKQKRLPDQMTNLPDRISLNGRYYLRNNMSTEPLITEDMIPELSKELQTTFLQLNSAEVAAQLTLRDFQMFQDIEPTEYIDDLLELDSAYGIPHLSKFSELVNKEMFWVISEVVNESNLVKRSKILKHFIKVARHCKECKNFNSMFAVISGLGHGSVSRLRASWDRLPTKYTKMFEDMQDLMDPSRNMSKYRNLINSDMVTPPLIPFFPVVKKDLTFIHLGNDSKVEGQINFEKLRMIAKEVRHICNMASAQYDISNMFLRDSQSVFSAFSGSMNASAVATMRRKRRNSTVPNPKKMFEEAQMVRRVQAYLKSLNIIEDESKLSEMSVQVEAPPAPLGGRKRDPSPGPANLEKANMGPKFDGAKSEVVTRRRLLGAEEPETVRKLMGLAEKVRPHNSKLHPLPPSHILQQPSPSLSRKPISPKPHIKAPPAVNLSAESSSVVSLSNMALKKSHTTGSVGSNDSNSPTNSVGSYGPQQYETDSGHNSIASSNYDSHSTSSVGSTNSPPSQRRLLQHRMNAPHYAPPPPPPTSRPPLPPYEVIVQNSDYSSYLQRQYQMRNCPPQLPDYQAATRQQQMKRKQGYHARSYSYEGLISQPGGFEDEPENEVLVDVPGACFFEPRAPPIRHYQPGRWRQNKPH